MDYNPCGHKESDTTELLTRSYLPTHMHTPTHGSTSSHTRAHTHTHTCTGAHTYPSYQISPGQLSAGLHSGSRHSYHSTQNPPENGHDGLSINKPVSSPRLLHQTCQNLYNQREDIQQRGLLVGPMFTLGILFQTVLELYPGTVPKCSCKSPRNPSSSHPLS